MSKEYDVMKLDRIGAGFLKELQDIGDLAGALAQKAHRFQHDCAESIWMGLMDAADIRQEQVRVAEEGVCNVCNWRGPLVDGLCRDCASDMQTDETESHGK